MTKDKDKSEDAPAADTATTEAAASTPTEPAQAEDAPRTTRGRTLTYQGPADSLRYEGHTLRRGEPAVVPSKVADKLLQLRTEKFVEAHEEQE